MFPARSSQTARWSADGSGFCLAFPCGDDVLFFVGVVNDDRLHIHRSNINVTRCDFRDFQMVSIESLNRKEIPTLIRLSLGWRT